MLEDIAKNLNSRIPYINVKRLKRISKKAYSFKNISEKF